MKMLENIGFPRNKIIDGLVFLVPNFEFQRFMEERIAYGFLEKTVFTLGTRMTYLQTYHIKNRIITLSLDMLSYINAYSEIIGNGEISLGKFCSFARKNTFVVGENREHNYRNVSSAPSYYFDWRNYERFMPPKGTCKINIGNDVWAGRGCIFKAMNPNKPLVVGDGAVIAADSVVVKNVPPYAIVGGNPAQVIKYRFPPHIIEAFLRIKWWDWDIEKLNDNFKYFDDVEKFISLHDK